MEASSAAEVAAKSALEAKSAEAAADAEVASRERCAAAARAVESSELRGKLQEAMMDAESGTSRAQHLEAGGLQLSASPLFSSTSALFVR